MKSDHGLPATALIKRQNRLFLAWLCDLLWPMEYHCLLWWAVYAYPLGLAPDGTLPRDHRTARKPVWLTEANTWRSKVGGAVADSQQDLLDIWVSTKATLPHTHHSHLVEQLCEHQTKPTREATGHLPNCEKILSHFYCKLTIYWIVLLSKTVGGTAEIIKFLSRAFSLQ